MQPKSKAAKPAPDATRATDPKNAGENAAVNDPNIDAQGEKLGQAGAKQRRADQKGVAPDASPTC